MPRPTHHGAAAVFALRDGAFEAAVVERMILDCAASRLSAGSRLGPWGPPSSAERHRARGGSHTAAASPRASGRRSYCPRVLARRHPLRRDIETALRPIAGKGLFRRFFAKGGRRLANVSWGVESRWRKRGVSRFSHERLCIEKGRAHFALLSKYTKASLLSGRARACPLSVGCFPALRPQGAASDEARRARHNRWHRAAPSWHAAGNR